MISTNLFEATQAHEIVATLGRYSLLEYKKDFSISPEQAMTAYYAHKMNIHKRQVLIELNNDGGVLLQAGAMQLIMGKVSIVAKPKSSMDFLKKFVGSKMTGETVIKPHYNGRGLIVLEPTYHYILLEDLDNWKGSMVVEDGMFLACDDTVELSLAGRQNVSSAVLGHEGLFNTSLSGSGVVALESPVPQEEIIIADLEDDELRIDGSMAIAWSKSLDFTVETATATMVGSALSKEGLVNVYRGTGRVMIAPVGKNLHDSPKLKEVDEEAKKADKG